MIARANFATLSKDRYRVPVDNMTAGYTDGNVQIINWVRFSFIELGLCGRQGNLRRSTSLSYIDKEQFEAALKQNQDSDDKAITELSKDL